MSDQNLNSTLDVIARILARCFLISMGAMLFSWTISIVAGAGLHQIFTYLYDVTRQEFDVFLMYGYAFMKILNFVLFLVPWAGIRLYLRGQQS